MPPPSQPAELPLIVLSVTVTIAVAAADAAAVAAGRVAADRAVGHRHVCRSRLQMPPPSQPAELPLIVLPVTVRLPPSTADAAAAAAGRVAADRAAGHRQRCRTTVEMPPPSPPAELPLIVLSVTVTLPRQL